MTPRVATYPCAQADYDGATVIWLPSPNEKGYKRAVRVHPAAGYMHDPELVEQQLTKCERAFPIPPLAGWPLQIHVLRNDSPIRTNGATFYEGSDTDGKHIEWWRIVLYGKLIPPHPAMTRYLVAHEFGHVVASLIAFRLYRRFDCGNDLLSEYARLRRLPMAHDERPGMWADAISEIFANDFRILVADAEPEYWPHTCPRPEHTRNVIDWWAKQLHEAREIAGVGAGAGED